MIVYLLVSQESWAITKMHPENFRESLSMPAAIFCEILNGLFFWLMLWIYVQNLKFVALPVPEISRGTQKLGRPSIRPCSLFTKMFNGLLFGWTLWMLLTNLKFVVSSVPEIIAIGVSDGVANPQSWGRGGRRESGIVPFERGLVSSYMPSIVTLPRDAL